MFTRDDIPAELRRHVPAASDLTHPVQGMTSEVAFVGGDTGLVFKRCRDPRYLGWLAHEHHVLQALEGCGVPAPRLVDYADVENANGREMWLVMTQLPGRSLRDELVHAVPSRRLELLRETGQLLNRLHTTELPRQLRRDGPWIDGKLAQARENLAWCDGTAPLLADLHRRRPAPVREVFIHGDFAPDNVLIDGAAGMSLIDWSDGGPGDPRHDVALALRAHRKFSATEVAAFFEGYGISVDDTTRSWFEQLDEFF